MMNEKMMKIKIKEGLSIRDPKTMSLMQSGLVYKVEKAQFWIRRLRDGDVEIVSDLPPKKEKEKAKKKSDEIEISTDKKGE